MSRPSFLSIACCFLFAAGGLLRAAEEIKPPFGLVWGENASRLERMLKNAKAEIKEKRLVQGGLEAWDVTGLVQVGLKQTVFYFRNDELAEVELIYSGNDWDQRRYDEFMGQIRQAISGATAKARSLSGKPSP
jgi:hypothetical protein